MSNPIGEGVATPAPNASAQISKALASLSALRDHIESMATRKVPKSIAILVAAAADDCIRNGSVASHAIFNVRSRRNSHPTAAGAHRVLTDPRTAIQSPIWRIERHELEQLGIDGRTLEKRTLKAIARTGRLRRILLNQNPIATHESFEQLVRYTAAQAIDLASVRRNGRRIKRAKKLTVLTEALITLCANSIYEGAETYELSYSLSSAFIGRVRLPKA